MLLCGPWQAASKQYKDASADQDATDGFKAIDVFLEIENASIRS